MRTRIVDFFNTFGKKFIKGFIVVFSGQSLSSIFNMITMLIFINTLGSVIYGKFVMIQASTTLVYSIFSFKGFQSLVHFLNKDTTNSREKTMGYIKSVIVLDVLSLILSIIVCLFFTEYLCDLMGWDKGMSNLIKLFSITLLTNFSGTTTGVIFTFQKYSDLVKGQIVAAFVKLILYIVLYFFNYSLLYFVVIEIISITISNVFAIYYTYVILKKNSLSSFLKVHCNLDRDFIKFNLSSNITSTIDLPVNQIATFIINKYLGFEFNAIYSVFEKIGAILNKIITPLGQIIYPEISKKIGKGDIKGGFKLVRNSQLLIYIVYIISFVFIISTYKIWFKFFLTDPDKYIIAFLVYIFYICYTGATAAVHSIFISLGYINLTPLITIIVNIIYLILLMFFIKWFGLMGVIIAFILQAMAIVITKKIIMNASNQKIN